MAARDVALAEANRIRFRRADFKKEITQLGRFDGCELLADMIEELPDWLAGADVLTVIGWAPYVGAGKAETIYARTGAQARQRRLRDLSPRQRRVIVRLLRARACGVRVAA